MKKKSANQSKGNFEYLWVGKVLGIKKLGVFPVHLEILALKGPKLAQMAKTLFRGLEAKKRPLFHLVLDPE